MHDRIQARINRILAVILAGFFAATAWGGTGSMTGTVSTQTERVQSDPVFDPFFEEIRLANPDLKAAREAWQAQLNRVDPAGSLPDPKLTAGLYLQEVETRVGPQQARLGISQALPWKGKLELKSQIAGAGAAALHAVYRDLELELYAEFRQQVVELAYLERAMDVTRRHLELLGEWEALMQARYETAASGLSDWIRVQLETDRLSDRLQTLASARTPVVAEINRILNRPLDSPFAVPSTFQLNLPETILPAIGDLQDAIAATPAIQSLARKVDARKSEIRLARKNFLPDFSVGLDFIQTGSARMDGVDGSGKDPVVFKFGMTLPLNRKKYRLLETAAAGEAVAAEQRQVNRVRTISSRLARLRFRFEDAVRKVELYTDKLIPDTQDSLEVTLRAYEAGGDGFLDMIDTERVLLALELDRERSIADGLGALADMERWTGLPLFPRALTRAQDHTLYSKEN